MSFNESWRQIWHLDRQSTSSSWTPRWWIAALFQRPHVKCWPTTKFCQNLPDSREKSNLKSGKNGDWPSKGRELPPPPSHFWSNLWPPVHAPASASASAHVSHYYIFIWNENPTNLPSLHFIALKWQYGEIFLKIFEHRWTWNNWISLEIGSVLDQTLPPSSPLLLSVACHQLQVRLYKLAFLSNLRENHFIQGRDLFPLSATP